MGYDISLFKEKPNDEFTCAICLGVFNNPITDGCGHVFCTECLYDWSVVKNTCPISCKKILKDHIRKPPLPFINMLNALQIKCSKCEVKYVRLDQYEEGCPDCRVYRFSERTSRPTNQRQRRSFGQSMDQETRENFWDSDWVKWAGVAGAVGAGLLMLVSGMKSKNRD